MKRNQFWLGWGLVTASGIVSGVGRHSTLGQDVGAAMFWVGVPVLLFSKTETGWTDNDEQRPTGRWVRWTPRLASALFVVALVLSAWSPFFNTHTGRPEPSAAGVLGAVAILLAFPWFCVWFIWGPPPSGPGTESATAGGPPSGPGGTITPGASMVD